MEEITQQKKSRGGKRPGAGRKPTGINTFRYQAMLTPELAEKARRIGAGNLSAGLRLAIEKCEA